MTALYVLGALLVVLLVGAVLAPLVEREPPDQDLDELPPDERREAAVEALGELEFEYRTDKLPEDEYRRLRARYGRIALDAEEEMDGAPPDPEPGPAPEGDGAGASEREGAETGAGTGGEPGASGPCGECGEAVPAGARFCPRCGARREQHEEDA